MTGQNTLAYFVAKVMAGQSNLPTRKLANAFNHIVTTIAYFVAKVMTESRISEHEVIKSAELNISVKH